MIAGFLWKGVVRDKRRSLLPFIVVAIGVLLIVFIEGLIGGMMGNMINMTADFQTGHVKIMTRAYLEDEEQKPNDLALLEVNELMASLQNEYPAIEWHPRIYFGGLLDIPDKNGETLAQGPVSGTAYNLLGANGEATRIGLEESVVAGRTIRHPLEALVSYDFAERFDVSPGDTLTFFGTTMYGSMSFTNLAVAGIVRFGTAMLDRGAIIVDLEDARTFLDMDDAAGEIFGFLPNNKYDILEAEALKSSFNKQYASEEDEYAPVMLQLADQNAMGDMLVYFRSVSFIMAFLLVLALSIVLWNTGVLSGIRRYNEFGIRLAMGEKKGHIFRTMLVESLFIGVAGSVAGTLLGLAVSWYLKEYGIDYGSMMDNINMMMNPVIRSEITPRMLVIGFVPGVLSMMIGTALAGIAIYKRKTAELFKELS